MTMAKPILFREDNLRDAELAPAAMEEEHSSNTFVLCHDEAEVLDYLYCRGRFRSRLSGNPAMTMLLRVLHLETNPPLQLCTRGQ